MPFVVLALVAAPGQGEEATFESLYKEGLAANPPDVSVELRLGGRETEFFQGEVIPVELVFSSTTPQRYELDGALYDRSGRLPSKGFHLEPADGAVDPLLDYFAPTGNYGRGGVRMISVLSQEPVVIELVLNEWWRFDRPGDYRLFVTSRRLADLLVEREDGEMGRRFTVTTNVVEFSISPAEPGWAARALEQAREDLDSADLKRRRKGCSVLRHLGTADAIAELVHETTAGADECRGLAVLGLFEHPDRQAVIRAMEAALTAPGGEVDASFVRRLAKLSWTGDHPVLADYGRGLSPEDAQAWRADFRRGVEDRTAVYAARLAGSIADK